MGLCCACIKDTEEPKEASTVAPSTLTSEDTSIWKKEDSSVKPSPDMREDAAVSVEPSLNKNTEIWPRGKKPTEHCENGGPPCCRYCQNEGTGNQIGLEVADIKDDYYITPALDNADCAKAPKKDRNRKQGNTSADDDHDVETKTVVHVKTKNAAV